MIFNQKLLALALILSVFVSTAHSGETVLHFRADLDASIVQPKTDPDHRQSTATAVAQFVLSYDPQEPESTMLVYDVQFHGLDVAPSDGANLLDDVTAVHIHDTTICVNSALCGDGDGGQIPGATAGTRHVLNILGAPRVDDADLQVFADQERILGSWDPSDANTLMPAPSQSIADPAILGLLFDGKLALMVHTNLVASGEIGGLIRQVPEAASSALLIACLGIAATSRRH